MMEKYYQSYLVAERNKYIQLNKSNTSCLRLESHTADYKLFKDLIHLFLVQYSNIIINDLPNQLIWILNYKVSGRIVGVMISRILSNDTIEISEIIGNPSFKNINTLLIYQIEEYAQNNNLKHIQIKAKKTNKHLVGKGPGIFGLYIRHGYKIVGEDGDDFILRKDLSLE